MFDKIREKANKLVDKGKELVGDGVDYVSSKMKKKDPNQIEQIGKKLTLEEMTDDYFRAPIEDNTKKPVSKEQPKSLDDDEKDTKVEKKDIFEETGLSSTTSYVGSIDYPDTKPVEVEVELEHKPSVTEHVSSFVKDVTTPTKTGNNSKQRKRKLVVKKVFRLIEWVIVILIILVIKGKYDYYSGHVKQKITYNEYPYVYVFDRNNHDVTVTKFEKSNCDDNKEKCNVQTVGSYNIKFSDTQMFAVRSFFDVALKFKAGERELTSSNLNNELYERVVRALMMNDQMFLSTDRYKDYTIIDYEQKSVYKERGFYYDENKSSATTKVTIALGEQEYDGYSVKINEAHYVNGNIVFYVLVEEPVTTEWKGNNAPIVVFEFKDNPDKIRVIDIKSGQDFENKGHLIDGNKVDGNSIADKVKDATNNEVQEENKTTTSKTNKANNSTTDKTDNSTTNANQGDNSSISDLLG